MFTQADVDDVAVLMRQKDFQMMDHLPIIRQLISVDAECHEKFYDAWTTQILEAYETGDYHRLHKLYGAQLADHQQINERVPCLLHQAILDKASIPIVCAIIKMTTNLKIRRKGLTALQIAIQEKQTTVASLIIRELQLRNAAEK